MYRQEFLLLRPVRYRPCTYLSKLIAKNGVGRNLVSAPGCKNTQGVAYTSASVSILCPQSGLPVSTLL